MNPQLAKLRAQFRGQKAKIEKRQFDNGPLPEGKYQCEIVKCGIEDGKLKRHYKIITGEKQGRYCFPFAPDLSKTEDIVQAARDIAAILGESMPWETGTNNDGSVNISYDKFFDHIEDMAHRCIGVKIEVEIKNSKTNKDDGTPWQNVWVRRPLGSDAGGVEPESAEASKSEKLPPEGKRLTPPLRRKTR